MLKSTRKAVLVAILLARRSWVEVIEIVLVLTSCELLGRSVPIVVVW